MMPMSILNPLLSARMLLDLNGELYTDLLKVPVNKPFEVYFYGIKACENNTSREDTLFVSDNTYGDLNRIIVYPRKVKGVENVQ